MKCIWRWPLIFALIFIPASVLLAGTVTIIAPSANVRAGPGTTARLVGTVTQNEQYEVLEERGGWYKLRLEDGTEGWVSGKVATLNAASRGREGTPTPAASGLSGAAAPQRRVALVIGNAAYPENPLGNPGNDASDMAALLQRLGFSVTLVRDADKRTMEEAVRTFTTEVPKGSLGLFYFSGHGAQLDGFNYLLPVGRFREPSDVKYGAVPADWVLGRMDDTGMVAKLLILDACRNNPFGKGWTRALDRGLASMTAPTGSLIAYATAPGKTASDGAGRHSPYTKHLLLQLPKPGVPVELMFKAVREAVE